MDSSDLRVLKRLAIERFRETLVDSTHCVLFDGSEPSRLDEAGASLVARMSAHAATLPKPPAAFVWMPVDGGSDKDEDTRKAVKMDLRMRSVQDEQSRAMVQQARRRVQAFVGRCRADPQLSATNAEAGECNENIKLLSQFFRLEERPLSLTAVGWEKAGKSSTLNAVIGAHVLDSRGACATRCPFHVTVKKNPALERTLAMCSEDSEEDLLRRVDAARQLAAAGDSTRWLHASDARASVTAHNNKIEASISTKFDDKVFYMHLEGKGFPTTMTLCDTPGMRVADRGPSPVAAEDAAMRVVMKCIADRMTCPDDFALVVQQFNRRNNSSVDFYAKYVKPGLPAAVSESQYIFVYNRLDESFEHCPGRTLPWQGVPEDKQYPLKIAAKVLNDQFEPVEEYLSNCLNLIDPDASAHNQQAPFFVSIWPLDRVFVWNQENGLGLSEETCFEIAYEAMDQEDAARRRVLKLAAETRAPLRHMLRKMDVDKQFSFKSLRERYFAIVRSRVGALAAKVLDAVAREEEEVRRLADAMRAGAGAPQLSMPYALMQAQEQFTKSWDYQHKGGNVDMNYEALFNSHPRIIKLRETAPLHLNYETRVEKLEQTLWSVPSTCSSFNPLAPFFLESSDGTTLSETLFRCGLEGVNQLASRATTPRAGNSYLFYLGVVFNALQRMSGIFIKTINEQRLKDAEKNSTNLTANSSNPSSAANIFASEHIKAIWEQGIRYVTECADIALEIIRTETLRIAVGNNNSNLKTPFWRQQRAVAKLEKIAAFVTRANLMNLQNSLLRLLVGFTQGNLKTFASAGRAFASAATLLQPSAGDKPETVKRKLMEAHGQAPLILSEDAARPVVEMLRHCCEITEEPVPTTAPVQPSGAVVEMYIQMFTYRHAQMIQTVAEAFVAQGVNFFFRGEFTEICAAVGKGLSVSHEHISAVDGKPQLVFVKLDNVSTLLEPSALSAAYGFFSPAAEKARLYASLKRAADALAADPAAGGGGAFSAALGGGGTSSTATSAAALGGGASSAALEGGASSAW